MEAKLPAPRLALTRRRLITRAAALGAVSTIAHPAISRAPQRPAITHGVQSGDVNCDSAIVWARADRPARMTLDVAATESFTHNRHQTIVDVLPETDFAAKCLLEDLPAGQE